MILSDRDIRKALDEGRVGIEPFDPTSVQPSSVDLRVGHQFRVFANSRYPYIDVRQPMEGLTELVEAGGDEPFILHPGEFVLASSLETVTLPDDLVARLEGKSSLGRLGLLIHSSLPAGEPVLFRPSGGEVGPRPIGEIVAARLRGQVVAFDPSTGEVGFHDVTGWYRGPPDRIYEVVLASGRRVRVTAGHNLFTRDPGGTLRKARTAELRQGREVAVPARLPGAPATGGVQRAEQGAGHGGVAVLARPPAAVSGTLAWEAVAGVVDTGRHEPVYDLEVRPGGRAIENFLAGHGGVFVSNTAGFIDAGWSGQITLELSNVANLPITIYPGMRIGQLAFFRLSSPAERPYGSEELGSKYRGQRGPTASKFFMNFDQGGS